MSMSKFVLPTLSEDERHILVKMLRGSVADSSSVTRSDQFQPVFIDCYDYEVVAVIKKIFVGQTVTHKWITYKDFSSVSTLSAYRHSRVRPNMHVAEFYVVLSGAGVSSIKQALVKDVLAITLSTNSQITAKTLQKAIKAITDFALGKSEKVKIESGHVEFTYKDKNSDEKHVIRYEVGDVVRVLNSSTRHGLFTIQSIIKITPALEANMYSTNYNRRTRHRVELKQALDFMSLIESPMTGNQRTNNWIVNKNKKKKKATFTINVHNLAKVDMVKLCNLFNEMQELVNAQAKRYD
jgi:hypothetical protein